MFGREDSSAKGASPGIEPESAKARHSNKRLGFTTPPLERPDYTNPQRPEGLAFSKFWPENSRKPRLDEHPHAEEHNTRTCGNISHHQLGTQLTSTPLYIIGGEENKEQTEQKINNATEEAINIMADKPSYQVGDEAEILFKNPLFPSRGGYAIVTSTRVFPMVPITFTKNKETVNFTVSRMNQGREGVRGSKVTLIVGDRESIIAQRDIKTPSNESIAFHVAPTARFAFGGLPDGAADTNPTIQVRDNFNSLAAWIGSSITDDKGQVELDIKMPDTLTNYRIFALASEGRDRLGVGESDWKCSPLMCTQVNLPHGEKYEFYVRATNGGVFTAPPAKVEEMYSPEVFGSSASDKLVIE
ncbi:hypothetical protein PROFUN_14663 [Planoprotostelium fungivorum]|uniref:Bacterial alpha-2-macroglobulin MG10 domain-containing protein n=1 Tax=Planoprotostelium fungivorum TaxID=1890364 RepID=A0A2P6MZ29_9EUKA|nr:hypothetical protein PROFUN_14663 [Planoprotostelium fungivorum]